MVVDEFCFIAAFLPGIDHENIEEDPLELVQRIDEVVLHEDKRDIKAGDSVLNAFMTRDSATRRIHALMLSCLTTR